MTALKATEDARRLKEDRAETRRLAQLVQDTRLQWTMAKARVKLAKDEHELAQWNLEAHVGVELDVAEQARRNKARKQGFPGVFDEADE